MPIGRDTDRKPGAATTKYAFFTLLECYVWRRYIHLLRRVEWVQKALEIIVYPAPLECGTRLYPPIYT